MTPRRAIVFSFDQVLDADSAVAAVRVRDFDVDPPADVPVIVTLAARGKDVVVRPADPAGWPAGGLIAVYLAGQGASTPPDATSILYAAYRGGYRSPYGPAWPVGSVAPRLAGKPYGASDADSGQFVRTFRVRGAAR